MQEKQGSSFLFLSILRLWTINSVNKVFKCDHSNQKSTDQYLGVILFVFFPNILKLIFSAIFLYQFGVQPVT